MMFEYLSNNLHKAHTSTHTHTPDAQVLPDHVVRALFSADWKDREQGVSGCTKILTVAAQSPMEAEQAFNVCCEVLKHTLK